ncbi:hypothetical protein, partial [Mesorhizobium sp.]|uniref:hypothetical protein n=1 Tax=Mesorhizobium sp. TaxID=1871066 RepID=UPI0025C05C94
RRWRESLGKYDRLRRQDKRRTLCSDRVVVFTGIFGALGTLGVIAAMCIPMLNYCIHSRVYSVFLIDDCDRPRISGGGSTPP